MSICPSPDKLDQMGSKYSLVILAAKRARQLKEGARRLVETRSTNPLTIALEEIAAGKIVPHMPEPSVPKAIQPYEPSDADIIGAGTVLPIDELGQEVIEDEVLQGVDTDVAEEDAEEKVTAVDVMIREGAPLVEETELLTEEGFDILPELDET